MFGCAPESIVDGPGIRFGVFVQGCSHHCPGCHNPQSQPHNNNKIKTVGELITEIQASRSCSAVTLSGGEPFEQAESLAELACALKEKKYNIWCYTGFLYEDLLSISLGHDCASQTKYCNKLHCDSVKKLLDNIDILVDGKFEEELKSYDCLYRGSTNQRLIDMKRTKTEQKVIEWLQDFELPERPSSW